jgi:hypothetical protein
MTTASGAAYQLALHAVLLPRISCRAATNFPFATPLYMYSRHLPPALSALYTELLP